MLAIDRRYLRSYDWVLFGALITLCCIGLLTVWSATYRPDAPYSLFFKKQLFGILSGFIFYLSCCLIDYRSFQRLGYFLYFFVMGLLVFTIIKGSIGLGGQRWINMGLFKFQPSECAKILFAPYFSYYLMTEKSSSFTFKTFIPLIITLIISFLLIVKQPDLGTALLLLFSGLILLWVAGITRKFFIIGALIGMLGAPIGWLGLKPYQKKRIAVFLGEGQTHKERYQIEQSKIAIGSGGLTGKGLLKGTQNKLYFLPEGRTDFIFSVLCEEWGFLGALFLLTLYSILFYRLFLLALSLRNLYVQLLALGLMLPLLFSTCINIAMVLGLLPVVGIPLPFMTYGISHLWMSFISLGFLQSIASRRFLINS